MCVGSDAAGPGYSSLRLNSRPAFATTSLSADRQGFFSGKAFVVVSHGLVKEETVPPKEIDRAVERTRKFEFDPASRAFRGED